MLDIPGKEVVKETFEKRLPIELKLYYNKSTHNFDHLQMIIQQFKKDKLHSFSNGARIELSVHNASSKHSDKDNKVSVTGYTSDKDQIEQVRKSLNDFVQREIVKLKEPPTETVDLRVLDFLKPKYKLDGVIAELQNQNPKIVKSFDFSQKDKAIIVYWKADGWEIVKSKFEDYLPY